MQQLVRSALGQIAKHQIVHALMDIMTNLYSETHRHMIVCPAPILDAWIV